MATFLEELSEMSVSCCSNFVTLVCLDELRRHIHREREAREKAERQSATLQRGKGTVVSGQGVGLSK